MQDTTTSTYFELKAKDCFGDTWSTGFRFDTLGAAKEFVNGDIEQRKQARRQGRHPSHLSRFVRTI